MRELDQYKGVPHHYKHSQVSVGRRDTGGVVAAVIYVANPDKVRNGLKPTREYLNHFLVGADYLSEEYVRCLRTMETLD